MTTTLIVVAHPEIRSFNHAWARASADASLGLGHDVLWSDLNSMCFDPVERAAHYPPAPGTGRFDPLKAQEAASESGRLPEDVLAEVEKLKKADRVIFHFPLWWFAPPGILKGWFDRVLVHGLLHDIDNRFDRGRFRGRKALFCVTTGASAEESAHDGREGNARMLLWPTAMTLRYMGYTVLAPEFAHGVHGYHPEAEVAEFEDRLRATLARQNSLIAEFDKRSEIQFNEDTDFGPDGRLLPDRPSYSKFIRHQP
ncbi:MAG: NAD(P)H-dependent oxidoreductase [Paracoccaceae bacterium]|nr:NAD(P)H-dependent oxidoreductase [Paracoccaceae bacterium]